ncbi:unnamed protein product [Rhodiola kirilowii]
MEDIVLSDSDWSSDSGYGENHDDLETISGGEAQFVISSLEQSTGRIGNFLSFERGFAIGDIVCSADDPRGQLGKVVDVNMHVDLESISGEIIEDVNSRKLRKIRSLSCGDFVISGSWIGRVDDVVVDRITILYDDGAQCEVTVKDPENVVSVSPSVIGDSQYPYYPGQRVRVQSSIVSKSIRWLSGSGKEKHDEGTVTVVEAGLVYVHWLSCALFVCGFTVPPPATDLDSKELTLLSCFSHAAWHIGDWCVLPDSELGGDLDMVIYIPSSQSISGIQELRGGLTQDAATSKVGKTYVIANKKIKIDVVWQDGSCTSGLASQSLIPVNFLTSHEFWPGQLVSDKGTIESSGQKWGVVTGVDAKERTVGVVWKTISGEQATETASAYELIQHPYYKYSVGDLVIRAVHNYYADEGSQYTNHASSGNTVTPVPVPVKNCGRDHSVYHEIFYLSCFGNVTGFKGGCVEVRWATGLTTKVEPFEICHLQKDEISFDIAMAALEEEHNSKVTDNKQPGDYKGKGKLLDHTRADENRIAPITKSHSTTQAAVRFQSNVALRLESTPASYIPISTGAVEDPFDKELLELLPTLRKSIIESEMQASVEANILIHQLTKTEDRVSVRTSLNSANPVTFLHFDMVANCPDHHFIDSSYKGSVASQVTRGWLKKVQQEWSNLEKNLPDTLYVRVFEKRMDLMRAVIVGSPGTPYHDGLFFFDIYLPTEFPNVPPKVHYHSGGLKLNPNLYESGEVCLSLINTFSGNNTEMWNTGSSTILQILISLQALVLNDDPYFNEAGYDRQIGSNEGERNAVSYKENAFILNCKSMLYLIRKPPQHFEKFMVEHFTSHAPVILTACKAYMEGAPVCLAFDAYAETESSIGFKLMLSKLVPQLVEAFSGMGIDCSFFTFLDN